LRRTHFLDYRLERAFRHSQMPFLEHPVARYTAGMRRFAASQLDLFAPTATPAAAPIQSPLAKLTDLLDSLRAADRLAWPDAAATMAEERRALGLARLAGADGDRLAAAIMQETERLLAATEQDAHRD